MSDSPRLYLRHVEAWAWERGTSGRVADLATWRPADPSNVGVSMTLFIGDSPDSPTDAFEWIVCTPAWLAAEFDHATDANAWAAATEQPGRRYWVVPRWDYNAVMSAINELLAGISAPTWAAMANRLSRHIEWEYEYRYDDAEDQDRLPDLSSPDAG